MSKVSAEAIARSFSPKSIAFIGGSIAELAIRRCVEMGYEGEIWPVHPTKSTVVGYPCFASIDELPGVPDAAYLGVNRDLTITAVAQLSGLGVGGCVCYAAGFGEMGDEGEHYQEALVEAAGTMPLVGPNCFGFVNYLDRCALWPYLFGCYPSRAQQGVAIISQSGNIAMNLSMNDRSVNFTHVIATGNQAVIGAGDYIEALLLDDRVRVIGMYIEGLDDVATFSEAARKAALKGVPLVVLKVGKTEASARQTSSHTSSLAGSDALYDALFKRLGVIRVDSLNRLLETVKILDLAPELGGKNIFSLSCSGGEAAIIADLLPEHELQMLPFSEEQHEDLRSQLPHYVTISNPFDYNTSIWGDQAAQEQCFTSAMSGDHDAALLIYDHPTVNSPEVASEVAEWVMTLDAFIAAHQKTGKPAFVICTISELLPESMRNRIIEGGVIPLMGFDDGLFAYAAAADYAQFRRSSLEGLTVPKLPVRIHEEEPKLRVLDEWASKTAVKQYGLSVPAGIVGTAQEVLEKSTTLNFPVVVKAVGEDLLHKSELGAVEVNLANELEVGEAIQRISDSLARAERTAQQFLVEEMVSDVVAELIIGVNRDSQFGPALVVGSGGILVELVSDSASLLLPTNREAILAAIQSLAVYRILKGFRGKQPGDIEALLDSVSAVADYALDNWDSLLELDVNPMMVLPAGKGVVAVDALVIHEAG